MNKFSMLDKYKLDFYRSKIGVLTSAEALDLALSADQTKCDVGVHDPAFLHFAEQARVFLNYAELLEKEENSSKEQT